MNSRRPPDPRSHRAGFTLIELLVVISVLGLLVALILPAVQSSREAARRAHCSNNLRQFGLALHAYASSMGTFPQGNNGAAYSLHVMILPRLEMGALYDAINFGVGPFEGPPGSPNDTAMGRSVHLFLCPSDRTISGPVGWTSYAGNNGINFPGHVRGGLFHGPSPVSLQSISDGLSSTSALSEWVLSPSEYLGVDPKGTIFSTVGSYGNAGEFDSFIDECRSLDPAVAGVNDNDKGRNWLHGEFGHTLYNHANSINNRSCLSQGAVQIGAYTAGSRHPGGAHSLMADGHVRFLRETLSLQVWRAFGSRNGGESIPADSY